MDLKEKIKKRKILAKNKNILEADIIKLNADLLNTKESFKNQIAQFNEDKNDLISQEIFRKSYESIKADIENLKIEKYDDIFQDFSNLNAHCIEKINSQLNYFITELTNKINSLENDISSIKTTESKINNLSKEIIASKQEIVKLQNDLSTFKELEKTYEEIANKLIEDKTKPLIKEYIDEYLKPKDTPSNSQQPITIEPNPKYHIKYETLKNIVLSGVIPMIVGPAGSGKSHAIEQLATDLKLPFYMANRIQNTFELTGFVNAAGKYVPTQFYNAFKNGGLFFFDEVDASSPEALVTINAAIAQGFMAFPGHPTNIAMHPDFKVVVAGNTYGTGATLQYTGRNKLDAATLDRFMIIDWDYDKTLERSLINDKDLLDLCFELRKYSSNYDKIIISTRGIISLEKIFMQEDKHLTTDKSIYLKKKFFASIDSSITKDIIENTKKTLPKNNKYYAVIERI